MRRLLSCQWKSMEHFCGEDAADWQYDMHRIMVEPTMDYADCDLGIFTSSVVIGNFGYHLCMVPSMKCYAR